MCHVYLHMGAVCKCSLRALILLQGPQKKNYNSWLKGREERGKCVCVEWSTAKLSLGLKASKGVSALKIKCYWLKSEAVTFHWDGIYYSEKRSSKYYAVCLWGKKKTPTSYKNTFLGGRIWFQVMSHHCVFYHLAKKWGFLKSISWSKFFHCLSFSHLREKAS